MKGENVLFIIGAVALGYYLAPDEVKQGIIPGGGGGTVLQLSMPEVPTQAPILNIMPSLPSLPTIPQPNIPEFQVPRIPEYQVPKLPEITIPKIPESVFPKPSLPEIKPDFNLFPNMDVEGLREKVAIGGAVGTAGAGAWFTKWIPAALSKLAPKVATKSVTTALKFVPYAGWAYALADLGATAYEFISGKNIAGHWLGWREFFEPEPPERASVPKTMPERLGILEGTIGLPEGQNVASDHVTGGDMYAPPLEIEAPIPSYEEVPSLEGFEFL